MKWLTTKCARSSVRKTLKWPSRGPRFFPHWGNYFYWIYSSLHCLSLCWHCGQFEYFKENSNNLMDCALWDCQWCLLQCGAGGSICLRELSGNFVMTLLLDWNFHHMKKALPALCLCKCLLGKYKLKVYWLFLLNFCLSKILCVWAIAANNS